MKAGIVTLVIGALLLNACADNATVAKAHHRQHVSPPTIDPPILPADSFDHAIADAELAKAHAAYSAGDAATARAASERSIAKWPVSIDAWELLIVSCVQLGDAACENYGRFFHAKLLMLDGLPMRTASLSFETVASNSEGSRAEGRLYDRKTLDMAERLWVFCGTADPGHAKGEPMQSDFFEEYPYAPMILVIGVGAGLLTGIKEIANK